MKEPNFLQQKVIEYPRVAGVIFILVGYYFIHTCIIEPYNDILNQVPEVRISFLGIFLGITFSVLGLTFLLFGNKFAHEIYMSPADFSKRQKIVFYSIVSIISMVVVALFFLVVKWLALHGYAFF